MLSTGDTCRSKRLKDMSKWKVKKWEKIYKHQPQKTELGIVLLDKNNI